MAASGEMKTVFRFERLEIWKKSIEFADTVYSITKSFPRSELFGLTSQLRRCSASISANIAEGSSRASSRDFSRFVEIAFGSLCETVSHCCVARRQQLLSQDEYTAVYAAAAELSRMLSSFRNSLGKWKSESADSV